jgi:hypothetical protein
LISKTIRVCPFSKRGLDEQHPRPEAETVISLMDAHLQGSMADSRRQLAVFFPASVALWLLRDYTAPPAQRIVTVGSKVFLGLGLFVLGCLGEAAHTRNVLNNVH